ncbi:hypothetical protein CEXT_422021 [Caerostris extrusa]|uniref:Uncharacterized protein n=1 Tax=Caerostris extrusa TaxID=172846 RepID=A0AAV4QSV7_CAEEX|nr:hypothetical protein CEXT_422021 [Caerostris extrusa]
MLLPEQQQSLPGERGVCEGKLFIIDAVTDVMKDKTSIYTTPQSGDWKEEKRRDSRFIIEKRFQLFRETRWIIMEKIFLCVYYY